MEINELLKDKREEILKLAAEHGAFDVRVFGSVARGEADADSDVDFLVKLKPGVTLLRTAALTRKLEGLIGRRIEVVSERGLRERIRENVLKEAVPV